MCDCMFERAVCDSFKSDGENMILLFKPDAVYKLKMLKSLITKEDLLDYLSGENHKALSVIFREDSR